MLHGERQRQKAAGGRQPAFPIVPYNLAPAHMGSSFLQNKNPHSQLDPPLRRQSPNKHEQDT